MIFNYLRSNKALLILGLVLFVSVASIGNSSSVRSLAWPSYADPTDVFADGCTSANALMRFQQANAGIRTNQLDIFRMGLMNARVYSPILDWDVNYSNMSYGAFNNYKPVDYLSRFGFTTIPFPNSTWVNKYMVDRTYGGDGLTQAEYDIRASQALASQVIGGGAFGKVSNRTRFVANPFLYQQASILEPSGMPYFPAIKSALGGNQFVDDGLDISNNGGIDSLLGPSGIPGSIFVGLFGIGVTINLQPLRFADQIKNSPNGIGGIFTLMQQLTSIAMNTSTPNGNVGGLLGDTINPSDGAPLLAGLVNAIGPVTKFAGVSVNVDTNSGQPNRGAMCNLGDGTMAPIYAFNNSRIPFRFDIPGTIYSIFTMFLQGRGYSYDGITIYGASKNGNYMLDCYGRGETPTLNMLTGETFGSKFGLIGQALSFIPGAAPVWEAIKRMPFPESGTMYYGLGMGFAFVMNPDTARLPDTLKYRSVDWTSSGQELIKVALPDTSGSDLDHGNSLNGYGQDFPFRLKLKEPYKLTPAFEGSVDQKEQDGTLLDVKISINKTGYHKGHDSEGYRENLNNKGGPTNDALQSQPRVKIAQMILQPGTELNELTDNQYGGSYVHSNRLDLEPGVDYVEGDRLCSFMKNKVNGATPDSIDCSYLTPETGDTISMGANTGNLLIKNIKQKIPAETEPGTKYCYAVYTDVFSNDIKFEGEDYWQNTTPNNKGFKSPRDKRMLSRTYCVVSGYKPSFQVRGGDLISGGVVDTEINTKEYLANPVTLRKYGSWVEYGVIAGGPIRQLASGAGYRVGMPAGAATNLPEGTPPAEGEVENRRNVGPLSFSNNWSSDKADHGRFNTEINDGFGNIVTQFTELAGTGSTIGTNEVDVAGLASGVHILRPNTVLRSSKQIEPSKSLILLAPDESNIRIAGNIELQDSYPDESALSQVVIAPQTSDAAFTININPDVSRVDSWLINPSGKLNTCFIDGGSLQEQTPRGFDWPCYNTLTVNGPVSAHTLLLRRSGSRDQNDVPAYELEQSVAGENFNLRPDAYIWAANYVSDFGRKLVTTNLLDLPPRF